MYDCRILRDQTRTSLERNQDKLILRLCEIDKNVEFIGAPTRFEPVTLGLEMQGIEYTNYTELHRFVILQYLFYKVPTKMA